MRCDSNQIRNWNRRTIKCRAHNAIHTTIRRRKRQALPQIKYSVQSFRACKVTFDSSIAHGSQFKTNISCSNKSPRYGLITARWFETDIILYSDYNLFSGCSHVCDAAPSPKYHICEYQNSLLSVVHWYLFEPPFRKRAKQYVHEAWLPNKWNYLDNCADKYAEFRLGSRCVVAITSPAEATAVDIMPPYLSIKPSTQGNNYKLTRTLN